MAIIGLGRAYGVRILTQRENGRAGARANKVGLSMDQRLEGRGPEGPPPGSKAENVQNRAQTKAAQAVQDKTWLEPKEGCGPQPHRPVRHLETQHGKMQHAQFMPQVSEFRTDMDTVAAASRPDAVTYSWVRGEGAGLGCQQKSGIA